MKRLFAAIKTDPDPGFLQQIRYMRLALHREHIKWVEEKNIHITLKFFGETDESLIPEITSILDSVAGISPVFCFRFTGLGIFGSSYNPRVIWAGIRPYDELVRLMNGIQQRFVPVGFPADRQNPVPHLTLGRIKNIRDKVLFHEILDRFRGLSSGLMNAEQILLFESILQRTGPEYHILEKYSLQT